MVGRLARYLRFVGCDTVYARGLTDEAILALARSEGRVIVTRDRELARKADRAVLLRSVSLEGQWRELLAAHPEVPTAVSFLRCTECNGTLSELSPEERRSPALKSVPGDRVAKGLPVFRCLRCGHLYWEGSHTADIRRRLESWAPKGPR